MKLCQNTLNTIPIADLPHYERRNTRPGIVHLGVGSFHRAHQAWYTEAVMNRYGGDWRIIGVSLRRPDIRNRLAPQDFLYSLVTKSFSDFRLQIIGALADVLVAPEDPIAVVNALSDPGVKVITLSITEKGYFLDAATGELDTSQPEIAHDLSGSNFPRSALGFLAAALNKRMQSNGHGLTIISCDNLSNNGRKLERAILRFSELRFPMLGDWIINNCSFPNTMVDRIVPATCDEDIKQLSRQYMLQDHAPVFTEDFSQWVIEKNFATEIPAWDKVGAIFVDNIAPFESLKLHMLNATHSLIAYLGCITGARTVSQVVSVKKTRDAILRFMQEEVQPTLAIPDSISVEEYQRNLLNRFSNSALNHRCAQIAIDGSQKIPNRFIPILTHRLRHGASIRYTSLAIAAWLIFLRGESGITIEDPIADKLKNLWFQNDPVDGLLALRAVFPESVANNPSLKAEVSHWIKIFDAGKLLDSL